MTKCGAWWHDVKKAFQHFVCLLPRKCRDKEREKALGLILLVVAESNHAMALAKAIAISI